MRPAASRVSSEWSAESRRRGLRYRRETIEAFLLVPLGESAGVLDAGVEIRGLAFQQESLEKLGVVGPEQVIGQPADLDASGSVVGWSEFRG